MFNSKLIKTLNRLRFSVLAAGQSKPDLWWGGSGLSATGQRDLEHIFPRTAISSAVAHTSILAKAHHDQRTRAAGVFHLFRLPTEIEAALHRLLIELDRDQHFGSDPTAGLWGELDELDSNSVTEAKEGPVNLGELNLSQKKDISCLAFTYKMAFEKEFSCVPYFQLST